MAQAFPPAIGYGELRSLLAKLGGVFRSRIGHAFCHPHAHQDEHHHGNPMRWDVQIVRP